jgi:hypothetical protein
VVGFPEVSGNVFDGGGVVWAGFVWVGGGGVWCGFGGGHDGCGDVVEALSDDAGRVLVVGHDRSLVGWVSS